MDNCFLVLREGKGLGTGLGTGCHVARENSWHWHTQAHATGGIDADWTPPQAALAICVMRRVTAQSRLPPAPSRSTQLRRLKLREAAASAAARAQGEGGRNALVPFWDE